MLLVTSNVVKHPKTPVDNISGAAAKPMLLDEVSAHIRRLNYSIRAEDTCVDWVRRFVLSMSGATRAIWARPRSSIPDASRDSGKASAPIRNPTKSAPQFFIGRCLRFMSCG